MAFDQSFLDELAARNDILDVVSRYVQLKRKGSNYFGLCPFHNEKSASFFIVLAVAQAAAWFRLSCV